MVFPTEWISNLRSDIIVTSLIVIENVSTPEFRIDEIILNKLYIKWKGRGSR